MFSKHYSTVSSYSWNCKTVIWKAFKTATKREWFCGAVKILNEKNLEEKFKFGEWPCKTVIWKAFKTATKREWFVELSKV
jgi:hypothetical protein